VRCRGVADVMTAVKFARSTGLPVAVRGGGHSYPGYSVCDGGIVIDLGPMKGISYFRACDVGELSDDVIDVMVENARRIVSPISTVAFFQMGGAVPRVDDSDTAFNGRNAAFTININGNRETAEGFRG
jgi:FAD binding domain